MGSPAFDADTLARLRGAREVRIETTKLGGVGSRRVIIWIVVVGERPYVRSYKGPDGLWFRETVRRPDVVIHAEDQAIPVRAVPATDGPTVEAVSQAFRDKYGNRSPGSTQMMLEPSTLETTLRLDPR